MIGAYAGWIIGGALLLALTCVITAIRNRPTGAVVLAGLAVLEVALIVQAVIAFTRLSEVGERATFIGYLAGTLVIPVAGVWWARVERTRWGPGVIAVAAFTVAVMTGRLLQLWDGTG